MNNHDEAKVEYIDGVLYIDGKALEAGSFVRGLVFLDNLDIEELPERITFLGELQIINCPNLTRLPNRMIVADAMNVERCANLESFGSESYFGIGLTIESCPKITSLPADMIVEGTLDVCNCEAFEPFTPNMNQATTFTTESFRLEEDEIVFYDRIPAIMMDGAIGKKLGDAFQIPMIKSFPQMDLKIASFSEDAHSGSPRAQLA